MQQQSLQSFLRSIIAGGHLAISPLFWDCPVYLPGLDCGAPGQLIIGAGKAQATAYADTGKAGRK